MHSKHMFSLKKIINFSFCVRCCCSSSKCQKNEIGYAKLLFLWNKKKKRKTKRYSPAMEILVSASQNTCTKNSLLTGLCNGVCVAEFVTIEMFDWYELSNRSSSSGTKKPTAIFFNCFFFLFIFELKICCHKISL